MLLITSCCGCIHVQSILLAAILVLLRKSSAVDVRLMQIDLMTSALEKQNLKKSLRKEKKKRKERKKERTDRQTDRQKDKKEMSDSGTPTSSRRHRDKTGGDGGSGRKEHNRRSH